MKVKKYIAKSMPEAMKTIRQELGNDAVILNSREIESGGFLGFFTKKSIEVIAAIDTTPVVRRKVQPIRQEVHETKPKVVIEEKKKHTERQTDLLQEIKQLKMMISNISQQQEDEREYPEPFQKIYDYLQSQEIEKTICLQIMKNLLKKWYDQEGQVDTDTVYEWLHDEIYQLVDAHQDKNTQINKQIVNIVGPTGVGKTTTIAKIAAHNVLKKHKKVALITTDTYRIAAIEQLKTYAKILNIPLEVAYSIDDFKKAKEQFASYDLVLVDSAGRNFLNHLYVEELKKVIDFDEEMETFLVLALTSKYRDMEKIYEQFSNIRIDKLIFTKQDETSTYGSMLNMLVKQNKSIAYITTGQNVPDDIVVASAKEITNTILLEVDNNDE